MTLTSTCLVNIALRPAPRCKQPADYFGALARAPLLCGFQLSAGYPISLTLQEERRDNGVSGQAEDFGAADRRNDCRISSTRGHNLGAPIFDCIASRDDVDQIHTGAGRKAILTKHVLVKVTCQ